MTTSKENSKRSWLTTVVAAIIGLITLGLSITVLPISNAAGGITFGMGLLITVVCATIAIEGKKGTLKELVYVLTFWK